MRRTSWVLGTTLAATAILFAGCAPPGEGSGEQEESPVGPGDSTVQDVGNTECLVGAWELDVQLYAEDALRTQMSTMPVSDPIGGGTRTLRFEESGLFSIESVDFTLTYTITVPGAVTLTPTVTTNEFYTGEWGWAGDAEQDELEFGDVRPVEDPTVTTTGPDGAELPGQVPVPTPVVAEDIPIRAICDGDRLQIDGPVPSLWYRAAG